MRTLALGQTGVRVSALCLGTMFFGTRVDEAMSFRLLDQYVDAGGSFLDTANGYAHWIGDAFRGGESETVLGRWMQARRNRDRLFVASKVGFDMPGVERSLRAGQIEAECEKSLKRLNTDVLDLYYAHVDDYATPQEETLAAFDRLVQAGKVRLLGASNFRAWRLAQARMISQAHGWPDYCCIQQRYTYLRPRPGARFDPQLAVNEDLLDYARVHAADLTLLAYSILLGGAYTRPDRPLPDQYAGPDSTARLAALREVAQAHGATSNQVVLAWMLHSDPPVLPLIAASTPQQLADNLGALEVDLSAEDMAQLDSAGA